MVIHRRPLNPIRRTSTQFLFDLGRHTRSHHTRRYGYPLSHHTAGRDQGFFTDPGTLQQDGTHSDNRAFPYTAAFQDGAVSNRYILTQNRGSLPGNMDSGVVLHVTPGSYDDGSVIAAQNRSKPDADTFLDLNIAQQYGCGSNENIPGNLRFLPIVFNDHKSSPFF